MEQCTVKNLMPSIPPKFLQIAFPKIADATGDKRYRLLYIICLSMVIFYLLLVINDLLLIGKDGTNQQSEIYNRALFWDVLMIGLVLIVLLFLKLQKAKLASWIFVIATSIRSILFVNLVQPGKFSEYGFVAMPLFALLFLRGLFAHIFFLVVAILAAFLTINREDLYQNNQSLDAFTLGFFFTGVFLVIKYFQSAYDQSEKLLKQEKDSALKSAKIIASQNDKLNELNEFKNHFFINISHEIRTPLTLIHGYANRLFERASDTKDKAEIQILLEESKTIKRLIDDILELSRLDSDRYELRRTVVSLSDMLKKAIANYSGLFQEKGIILTLQQDVANNMVYCDAALIEKVIGNLLTNALKFSYPDSKTSLNLTHSRHGLLLQIKNEGPGISSTDLKKVFKRFYQVQNNFAHQQGSGIGLSIVKSIVERHGFKISATSKPGSFALFEILFPTAYLRSVAAIKPQEQRRNVKSEVKQSILIVDDNLKMRDYLCSLDALSQYSLFVAENGEKALELLRSETIHLVLSDYMMPTLDGMQMARKMRSEGFMQPVIIVTAQSAEEKRMEFLRIGIDGYLLKPFAEEELAILIKRALAFEQKRKAYLQNAANKSTEQTPPSELAIFSKKLNSIIREKLADDDLNVSLLADRLHVTERTLFRRVKELCGETPSRLIMEARLQRAKFYHDQGIYKSVRQLSLAVGIKNSTRFAKKFKETFGSFPQPSER